MPTNQQGNKAQGQGIARDPNRRRNRGGNRPRANGGGGRPRSGGSRKQNLQKKLDSTLYNPAAILGGKQLRQSVNKLVNLQTKPLLQDLELERRRTEGQSERVTGNARTYFDQLAARQQELANQAQQSAAGSAATQSGIAQSAQGAVAEMAKAAQGRVNEDVAVRGDIAGGAAEQLAKSFAERAASQEARSQADQTAANLRGASGATTAIEQAMASGQRGGEQMGELTDRFATSLGDIGAKRREVLSTRSGLRAKTLQELRQGEFEKLITMEGLGLDREKLAADTSLSKATLAETRRNNRKMRAEARARNRLTARGQDITARGQDITARGQDLTRQTALDQIIARQLDKKGGLTPAQRESRQQKSLDFWDKVESGRDVLTQAAEGIEAANAERAEKGEPALPWNDATARAVLREEGYKGYEIDTVISLRPSHGGKLSPALTKLLRKRRIEVPKARRGGAAQTVGQILAFLFD